MHLETTRTAFCSLWVFIFVFQVVNGLFLVGLAATYLNYNNLDSIVKYLSNTFMFSDSILFLREKHNIIGTAYMSCSMPFVYGVARMIYYSVRRRELATGPRQANKFSMTTVTHKRSSKAMLGKLHSRMFQPRLHQRFKSISIVGPHFTFLVLVIETLEVILETVQGYQFSKYISNLQINQLYALMIFINCCSTPLTHYFWVMKKHDVMMGRLVCAIVDIVLDCAWGTILQGMLFYRYYQYYNGTPYVATFVNADRELRKILVVSTQNFVLSIFPFFSSANVMYEVLEALSSARIVGNKGSEVVTASKASESHKRGGPSQSEVVSAVNASSGVDLAMDAEVPAATETNIDGVTASRSSLSIASTANANPGGDGMVHQPPTQHDKAHMASTGPSKFSSNPCRFRRRVDPDEETMFVKIYLVLMMLYGIMVLCTSIAATDAVYHHPGSMAGCSERLYPWFTQDITCVGRQVSCSELGIAGHKDELTPVLRGVSQYLLASIEFVDCPAFEAPPCLQEFNSLVQIALTNVTVVEWGTEAAVTDAMFPQLITLQFETVHFQTIPLGIVSQRLSDTFEFVAFDSVNANLFFDLVVDNWSMTVYLYCSSCGFTSFPAAIQRMDRLQQILLHNNHISEIHDGAIGRKRDLVWLRLPHNPVVELPQDVWDLLPQLVWITVQFTNVSNVPSEALSSSYPSLALWGDGSPLCDSAVVSSRPAWLRCDGDLDAGWL